MITDIHSLIREKLKKRNIYRYFNQNKYITVMPRACYGDQSLWSNRRSSVGHHLSAIFLINYRLCQWSYHKNQFCSLNESNRGAGDSLYFDNRCQLRKEIKNAVFLFSRLLKVT